MYKEKFQSTDKERNDQGRNFSLKAEKHIPISLLDPWMCINNMSRSMTNQLNDLFA